MKIGFDISQTGRLKTGCGFFAASLIQALSEVDRDNRYILYPRFGATYWDRRAPKDAFSIERPNVARKVVGRSRSESLAFWKDFPEDGHIRLGDPDIVHANNFSCPVGLKRARVVYTLYDMSVLDCPEYTTEQNRISCFEGIFDASISADLIIAISNYSAGRFLYHFPHYPRNRTQVVYLGNRFEGWPGEGSEQPPVSALKNVRFWLTVGTLEPRKNLRKLLKAYASYRTKTRYPNPLVLAGGKGWLEGDLSQFIRELGMEESVLLLGYVSDKSLAWLYRHCLAFIYPSLYEGFGLPVLEAMGFGAAVILSNRSSLPEVGGDASHYIDPEDEKGLCDAMLTIDRDESYRQLLKFRAEARSREFSWRKIAEQVLKAYEEVLLKPKYLLPP